MKSKDHYDVGLLVLTSNAHWKALTIRKKLRVVLKGKWQTFTHLGCRLILTWYNDVPYLMYIGKSFRKV